MKTRKQIFSVSLCWLMCSTLVIAQNDKEIAAIKDVIVRETTAFFQTDYKDWMDCWVHAPYSYWSNADSTGIYTYEGWQAIEIAFTDYFVTSKPSTAVITRKWHDIRVYGNGAYARFIQYTTNEGILVVEDELRVLEKQNGKWKIVLVGLMKGSIKNKMVP